MEEKFRKPLRLKEQKTITVESLIRYGKKLRESNDDPDYMSWVNTHPEYRKKLKITSQSFSATDPKEFIEKTVSNKLVRCQGVDDGLRPNHERWHVNNTLFHLCKEGGMRSGEWDIPASVVVFFDELRELLYVGVPGYKFFGHLDRLAPMVHFFSDGTCFETTELVDMKRFLMVTKQEVKLTKRFIKDQILEKRRKLLGVNDAVVDTAEVNAIYNDLPKSLHEHKLFDMEYYVYKGFKRDIKDSDARADTQLKLTKNTPEDFEKARSLGISCVYDPEQELSYLLTTPQNMKLLGGDVHPNGTIYRFPNYFKKCELKSFRKPVNLFEFILHKSNLEIFNIMVKESVDLWNHRFYKTIPESPKVSFKDIVNEYNIEKFNELLLKNDKSSKQEG